MSPYTMREHPHWAAVMVRTFRVMMYAMATTSGITALLFTPASLNIPAAMIVVVTLIVAGFVCLIGTIVQNYIIEWISLFFLTGGMSCYVISVWFTVFQTPARIAGTAVLSMLVFSLAIRLVDLTVYWLKNVKVARLARELSND